jgi:rod shape-determining protein MreC
VNTQAENRRLFSQTNLLKARNSKLLEIKHENDRLRDLLGLQQATGLTGVVVDVIAYEPSNWSHAVTVDKGTNSGIAIGSPVLVGDGVVGQIVAANVNTARVLLLTDPSSAVDAFVQTSRVRGIVVGMGTFEARWNYVLSKESILVGDRVVTSGMDEVFPKGLIIGVVKRVHEDKAGRLFKRVDIEPAVDFSRLETVLVVTGRSALSDKEVGGIAVDTDVNDPESEKQQSPE